jgi:type IV secretion system protein VirD4
LSRVRIGYDDLSFSRVRHYPGKEGHMVTVAPTGSGKGRDVLIPALLDQSMKDFSCIVVDPKGQLAAVTGPEAARMGKRVIMLNPFSIWPECIGPGAERFAGLESLCDFAGAYNPMATLDPASDAFVPDAEALAQAIVYQEREADHWIDSARELVTGLIMHAVVYGLPHEKNLAWVRSTVCNRTRLFELAARYFGDETPLSDADEFITQKLGRFGEPEAKDNKEVGSIISTAVTQTSFIGNGAISKNLAGRSFLFRELRQRPTVLFLILPGRRLKTCSRWFRLIVGAALNELMDEQKTRGLPCLFLLDEFAQLGPMKAIEDAFGIARDYALTLWPILQDLNQLKRDYKDGWETMLANAGAVQFFRPEDNTTAEYISKRTDDIVDPRRKENLSVDLQTGNLSKSSGIEWKDKKYLEPSEVRKLGTNEFLLFAARKDGVFRMARRSYWDTPEFKRDGKPIYAPDPYH